MKRKRAGNARRGPEKAGNNGSTGSLPKRLRRIWGRFWHFFWEEDTLLSWIVNIIVAFILIKWIVYPGLGLVLQTDYPVVAVISNSMEHDNGFGEWWSTQGEWYEERGISEEDFTDYIFSNGFNRGDIMILQGAEEDEIKVGDVIVYKSYIREEPIIHRVVRVNKTAGGSHFYVTKGDHNDRPYPFEIRINPDDVLGKALFRIPYMGWIKITFVCAVENIIGHGNFITCMGGA
ncbi:MAG: signal peptidase I [Candidatus Woesearchaeota archaeon]